KQQDNQNLLVVSPVVVVTMRLPQEPVFCAIQNHTNSLLFRNRFENSLPEAAIGMILPDDENDSVAGRLQQLILGDCTDRRRVENNEAEFGSAEFQQQLPSGRRQKFRWARCGNAGRQYIQIRELIDPYQRRFQAGFIPQYLSESGSRLQAEKFSSRGTAEIAIQQQHAHVLLPRKCRGEIDGGGCFFVS